MVAKDKVRKDLEVLDMVKCHELARLTNSVFKESAIILLMWIAPRKVHGVLAAGCGHNLGNFHREEFS